ncbi:unnamed protein product [Gordionus sp. m RMFG-2023]
MSDEVIPNGKKNKGKLPNPRDLNGWLKYNNKINEKLLKVAKYQPERLNDVNNNIMYKNILSKIEGKRIKDDVNLLSKAIIKQTRKREFKKQKLNKKLKK